MRQYLYASLMCFCICLVATMMLFNGCTQHITAEDREFLKARQEIFDLKKQSEKGDGCFDSMEVED